VAHHLLLYGHGGAHGIKSMSGRCVGKRAVQGVRFLLGPPLAQARAHAGVGVWQPPVFERACNNPVLGSENSEGCLPDLRRSSNSLTRLKVFAETTRGPNGLPLDQEVS
jgi:hypothetical protein